VVIKNVLGLVALHSFIALRSQTYSAAGRWTSGLISPQVFSLAVVLVLATTLLTPMMLHIPFRQSKLQGSSMAEAALPEA
jgi:hypothetical protein